MIFGGVPIRVANPPRSDPNASGIRALMPLAFGSLLGGLATLIGTPPNIIISSYRAEILGKSFGEGGGFGMFEFAPVGAAAALAGIAFIALFGYRLIPHRESSDNALSLLSRWGINRYPKRAINAIPARAAAAPTGANSNIPNPPPSPNDFPRISAR